MHSARHSFQPHTYFLDILAACAAGAASDDAFRLYLEMRKQEVPLEAQTFSALLSAFSAEVRATLPTDRRTQLVLMERAFHLLDDMRVRTRGVRKWG